MIYTLSIKTPIEFILIGWDAVKIIQGSKTVSCSIREAKAVLNKIKAAGYTMMDAGDKENFLDDRQTESHPSRLR